MVKDPFLYLRLQNAYKEAYADSSWQTIQRKRNEFWHANKSDKNAVEAKIASLRAQVSSRQASFATLCSRTTDSTTEQPDVEDERNGDPPVQLDLPELEIVEDDDAVADDAAVEPIPDCAPSSSTRPASPLNLSQATKRLPAQESINEKLNRINGRIADIDALPTRMQHDYREESKALLREKKAATKRLQRLEQMRRATGRVRSKKRLLGSAFVPRGNVGRPPIEFNQPGIRDAILSIFTQEAAADPKRRSETLSSTRTLPIAMQKLKSDGWKVTYSSLYRRILPAHGRSYEAARHINPLQIKAFRPENSKHADNPDSHFAAATMQFLRDLAVTLGSRACIYLSQDDKAKVPIGRTAANVS